MTINWKQHFPYPEFRPGQEEIIDKIIQQIENGTKHIIIEAPTGSGKSAIGYTIGSYFNKYYYITAQKMLQSQLTNDFGENGKWSQNKQPMIELKGRNAYECLYYKIIAKDKNHAYVDCAKGACKKIGRGKLKECIEFCPYWIQRDKAVASNAVLMNFHSFIFQTEFTQVWPNKKLLIIDEAHGTESILMDYVTLEFTDKPFDVIFPELTTPEEYLIYFEENNFSDIIKTKLEEAIEKNDDKSEEYWTSISQKYINFKESLTQSETEWIVKFEKKEGWRSIKLKPLYIHQFTEPLLFSKADHILFMSATILNPGIFRKALGIPKEQSFSKSLANLFPIENRKIHYTPCGKMNYNNKNETIPKMLKAINKICKDHENERGIIHTHNFEIADKIIQSADKKLRERIFFQREYANKEKMLELFTQHPNGIIVAPAMHEGLDLKGDLSRFQIICKVPYPSYVDDPQLKRRMEESNAYYNYLTALKLVQCYGRSIRSETDWAKTYVLDEDFKRFCSNANNILPGWFKESIVW